MIINQLLEEQNITMYRLSRDSGVAQATIHDICSGKAKLERCSAGTIYKIAKALGVTIEYLIEAEKTSATEYRCSFDIFKSNICHQVKDMGDMDFIIRTLEQDEIRLLYEKKWYPESLYLLAMVDYLSRENELPICTNYNDIRSLKLSKPLYPNGVLAVSAASDSEHYKEEARKNAIPEFMRFNIVESEVRNVC